MNSKKNSTILLILLVSFGTFAQKQILTLKEAVNTSLENYGTIKAKNYYVDAAQETVKQAKREYLPNLNISAQQTYGTINGQNGPLYGLGGLGVASSGLPLPEQNWNAAFGALYLANVNWDFFTFGRIQEKINLSKVAAEQNKSDLEQEKFQHKIKVSAAYLNLLATQRLLLSQRKNLDRAEVFKNIATQRVKNGLLAGVDSVLATAEVSKAKILLNQAKEAVKEQNNKLSFLMGTTVQDFVLDTTLVYRIPASVLTLESSATANHPVLEFYKNRVDYSNQQVKLFKRNYYPTFNLFGVFQTRASGFDSQYAVDQHAYTRNYFDGIDPSRSNYLVGVGVVWNLTAPFRVSKQVHAQKLVSEGLQQEYEVVNQELKAQLDVANAKIQFAMDNYNEAPIQVNAASQAYRQKNAMYKNGLATMVDITQTLYTLNRAEIDRDIVNNNVWQSLLLKAAATGDFNLFINEF
ncbi:TolC family protein [Flavobacterium sp. '19STA2R22 D10 B1']|uniref:TolC family protein n=1 Tax=Flavobacterium aerium TaxID=3037261 RepID=UPI00278C7D66|nr:TolC family protein [Flavobacterium sp. '19STA2R22 D10 B1']